MLEWRGPAAVYAIDAASYLAILLSLLGVRYRPVSAPELRPSFRAALEGIKLLRSMPILWATTLLDFFATFFAGAMLLLPFFSAELGVGKRGYGFLYAAPSAGAVVAALVLSTLDPPKRPGLVVLVSVAAYGLATAAFGASPSFWLAILFLALSGAADMVSTSVRHTLRQELTPNPLRGRLNSVSLIFFAGGPLLGEVEAGVVAKVLGVRGSIVSGGIACVALVGLFAWAAPWLRRYRRGDPAGASTLPVTAPEQAPRCP